MFIWKKEFELGIKSIDNQHMKLLEIGNRINELLTFHADDDDNYDGILEVIQELKDYTIYHFTEEEVLLKKYNYTGFNQHKKEHDAFIENINFLDISSINGNQAVFLRELLNEIVKWVFHHIITTDYMYKDYLIMLGAN